MLRLPRVDETPALVDLALRTSLFSPAEADALLRSTLDAFHRGTLGPDHRVLLAGEDAAIGWTYFAADPAADGVWDVWWIGVDPAHHARGIGTELLDGAERVIREHGGRVVVIATSDAAPLARARRFYPARGYAERGRIPDFYGPDEAKVIYAKTLRA